MAKKKQSKKNTPTKVYNYYKVSGDKLEKKAKFCPKCGVGVYLAQHKNRFVCGKCGYTEMIQK